jgi:hypothetical protein
MAANQLLIRLGEACKRLGVSAAATIRRELAAANG